MPELQARWTWLPGWVDAALNGEAGRKVTFRRVLKLSRPAAQPILLRLSADTRYKLLINGERVMIGPTRGSDKVWYYDTVDIAKYLNVGNNIMVIQVLRYFPSENAAISFARTPMPGLTVFGSVDGDDISTGRNDQSWEGRVEQNVFLKGMSPIDIFLHVSNPFDLALMKDF